MITTFEEIRDVAFSTAELEAEADLRAGEMNAIAEQIKKLIGRNARVAQNQKEYAKQYEALTERFDEAKAKHEAAQDGIAKKRSQRQMMERFCDDLKKLPEIVDDFDEDT